MASVISHTLHGAVRSAQRYGLFGGLGYVFDQARVHLAERRERFDERYGTTTEGMTYPWQLSPSDPAAAVDDTHPYEAFPAKLIREVISSLPVSPPGFSFIDLGSGKGRALLVASEFSFRRMVGVEISHDLSEIAAANLEHCSGAVPRPSRYELWCMDAAQYHFENEPSIVFLFNPFGKRTFDLVISRLEHSLRASPRTVFVVYANPRYETRLKRSRLLKSIGSSGSRLRPWRRYVVYGSQ